MSSGIPSRSYSCHSLVHGELWVPSFIDYAFRVLSGANLRPVQTIVCESFLFRFCCVYVSCLRNVLGSFFELFTGVQRSQKINVMGLKTFQKRIEDRTRSSVGRALDSRLVRARVPFTKVRGSRRDGRWMLMSLLAGMVTVGERS